MAEKLQLSLNEDSVKLFGISKIYKNETKKEITGIDFSRCGNFIVASCADDTVKLYNSVDGKLKRTAYVRKHGAKLVQFTHHSKAVLEAGNKNNDCCVRYHSLHDNSYLRRFEGHQAPITNLMMSPISDEFLTASLDKTVRLWDLRQQKAVAVVRCAQQPVCAFDNEGLIFAIGASRTSLKLFDLRNYSGGAFTSFLFDKDSSQSEWCSMQFSPDSKSVLINSNQNFLMCLDAFEGKVSQTYFSHENTTNTCLHGTFSPDSKYVICGSTTGDVHVWDRASGEEVAVWRGHPEPVTFVRWNLMRAVCATGGQNLCLWQPKTHKSILKVKEVSKQQKIQNETHKM